MLASGTLVAMHLWEYFAALFHGWVGRMSGVASIILAFLPIIFPGWFANSQVLIRATWIAAVVCFAVANWAAWLAKRNELETERERHKGSDIRAKIVFGYLDWRALKWEANQPIWTELTGQCYANFQIDAVNHNETVARFRPEETTVQVRIGAKDFSGRWIHTVPGLAVRDSRRSDRGLIEFFDGLYQGLEQGNPWRGNVGFVIDGLNRLSVAELVKVDEEGKNAIVLASVTLSIYDTLGKRHRVIVGNAELAMDELCTISESI